MTDIFDNKLTDNEARELTARFFDGATTLAEEERLYVYYAMGPVAPILAPYRELMLWMAEGCQGERPVVRPAKPRYGLPRWCGVAAIAALVAFAGGRAIVQNNALNTTRSVYAGSYLVRDGVRITDLPTVLASFSETQSMTSQLIEAQLNIIDELEAIDSISEAQFDAYFD